MPYGIRARNNAKGSYFKIHDFRVMILIKYLNHKDSMKRGIV
jgi:hypothetical protein